mmetsp:Transcript_25437/g.48055  ORF Transcript_25437/g.48055 Transcript_25437/m.48055 type:complete len:308 (-) Transcript_25437:334-1257(-)|eukprot:CAMPEP_0114273616 /NCGR_PEP_ID=MMETSP0058-20121206/29229_1 /TAXON_ID=36894 /ORGANISM="Pyramimonas parkeae, CCMP726" /LENGTH=307 /DNA_ID=CAMNT_0001393157 /DNA_START=214 /DNA_END=1137 /DNA_ORIENTATION=+
MLSNQQEDVWLGTPPPETVAQQSSLAFTQVQAETSGGSPPSSTHSQGLPIGMPRGLARFLRVRKKAWVEGQSGASNCLKPPEFLQRGMSPDCKAANTVETSQPQHQNPDFISNKAIRLRREPSCTRRRALFESDSRDPKTPKFTPLFPAHAASCSPASPAQPKEEHVDGESPQVETNTNEDTNTDAGSNREMCLRLSPDSDDAQDDSNEEFQRWLSERVQREARSPPAERIASSLRECASLQAELDLALSQIALLRGEGLSGCTDLHLHHIAKDLEHALSSVHAERRRRGFNRRMQHRSGAFDSDEQ